MVVPIFLIRPPSKIDLPPLFGKTRVQIERVLGTGRVSPNGTIKGHPSQIVAYAADRTRDGITVVYASGRAYEFWRGFPPSRKDIGWIDAMRESGLSPKGVRAAKEMLEGMDFVVRLRGGSLPPGYVAAFHQPAMETKPRGCVLRVTAPL